MNFKTNKYRIDRRPAFTLVELMVAMTITLLLMAGLAKTFGVIGESIKTGRSKVTLSSKMRNLSFSMRNDLSARTVDAKPPLTSTGGKGYFMYYEGPLTEHTFGLYGASPERVLEDGTVAYPFDPRDSTNSGDINPNYFASGAGPTYRRHGRVGDFDDYIAFTAEAVGDEWFTGKVPAYLVRDGLVGAAAMEPTLIQSKYAEIIIWASPRWSVDPTSNSLALAPNPTAMPLYRDEDRDLVPDGIVLHRRTLLIRPDLNVRRTIPDAIPFDSQVLRPQNAAANPFFVPTALERIYPIGTPNNGTSSMLPNYADPGSNNDNRLLLTSNWLVGMAPLHHFFDLSLRRIIHPDTGDPTGYVAANSLESLVQPHNRFAHVRYPGRYFGAGNFGGDTATSMPLLALGWNDAILNWQGASDLRAETSTASAPAWFPRSHPSPRTLNSAGTAGRSGLFNGWLLPHFELGNPNPVTSAVANVLDNPLPPEQWRRGYLLNADARWDRTGEDVVAANVLAFDIRGYDPTAPVFITSGPDGQPGRAGVDDDGVAPIDQTGLIGSEATTELGTYGSDDQLIKVTDLGIYDLIGQGILDPEDPSTYPLANTDRQALTSKGAFVDLLYPYLAGSPLRTRTAETGLVSTPPLSIASNGTIGANYRFLTSKLSLFPILTNRLNSIKRSGKLLHTTAGNGNIVCFQPTYDTWTDGYETDGFDQSPSPTGRVSPPPFQRAGTVWVLNTVIGGINTPRLLDPAVPMQLMQIDTRQHDRGEPETSAPIAFDLPAVSVSVRLLDPSTEEMSQFTLVEGLQ